MADQPPPEASSPQGPESHEAWANTTKSLVGTAQTVTSELFEALKGTDALTGHKESAKFGMNGRPRNVDRGPQHAKVLDAKLEVTKAALNSVDGSAQRCSQIVSMLGHERQSKWAALKVVEWRLALRERRPKTELFRDHLQDHLESEKQTLEDSRKLLVSRAAEMKLSLEECEATKAALARCVRCMICFAETNPSPPKKEETSAPNSPAAANAEADPNGEGGDTLAEGSVTLKKPEIPTDVEGLIARAKPLHEMSLKHYLRMEKFINQQKAVCQKANEKVMAAFLKRTGENKELKENLEKQIHEMEEAMGTAEKSIERMKKDIEFFGHVELQPKVDSTRAIVEKLKVAKEELRNDLMQKVVSMRIDDCCRKITAERTMQPPESMPVAALLEGLGTKGKPPAGRKRPQMTKQHSSPAFVNGNIDSAASTAYTNGPPNVDSMASTATNLGRPASPAGLSSPLKAAATASLQ